jgi:foldase protein PrsA
MYLRQRAAAPAIVAFAAVPMLVVASTAPSAAQARKPAAAAASSASRVAASVNGEVISREQLADELIRQQTTKLSATNPVFQDRNRLLSGVVGTLALKKMAANGGSPVTVSRSEIVDFLYKDNPPILYQMVQQAIGEKAIQQEARKKGVVATDAEVNEQMKKAVDSARSQYRLQGSDADILKQIGVSDSYLRPHIRTQVLLDKLVRKDLTAKTGKPFGDSDYVSASHILVQVTPDPANPMETEKRFTEAKTKIDAIAADIKSGKTTFEKAAQENNTDATKFKGGSLGTFTRGQMVPEFDKAVFSLPKGQISEPVRTAFGWHLIRVDKLGSELTGPEKALILNQLVQQKSAAKVQDLVKNAKVVNNIKPPAQPGGMMPG